MNNVTQQLQNRKKVNIEQQFKKKNKHYTATKKEK